MADQIDDVGHALKKFGAGVENAEKLIPEKANPLVDEVSEFVKKSGKEIQEAHTSLLKVSKSPLLSIIPLAVLAYFGLIHVAFFLTGLAFILN